MGFSEIVADVSWFDNYLDRLAAVTIEDVQRVAQTYFKPALRNVGWYMPVGDGDAESGGHGDMETESDIEEVENNEVE